MSSGKTALENSDGAFTAVTVKVTDSGPLDATIWATPGLDGNVTTVLAIPSLSVNAVVVLTEAPPEVTLKVTWMPRSGLRSAPATATRSAGSTAPDGPEPLLPLTIVICAGAGVMCAVTKMF